MDSRSDQFERHCHLRIKLEDAIELLGPSDFVRSHAPGKAADATQMLCFPKERFTSLQRCFPARSDLRRHGQSVNRIVESRRKARNGPDPELRTTPIDQVNAAVTIGGRIFHKLAQGSKNVGEWAV